MDLDNFDGYEELPEEFQEKVRNAFELGHIPEEDKFVPPTPEEEAAEEATKAQKKKKAPRNKKPTEVVEDKDEEEEYAACSLIVGSLLIRDLGKLGLSPRRSAERRPSRRRLKEMRRSKLC